MYISSNSRRVLDLKIEARVQHRATFSTVWSSSSPEWDRFVNFASDALQMAASEGVEYEIAEFVIILYGELQIIFSIFTGGLYNVA